MIHVTSMSYHRGNVLLILRWGLKGYICEKSYKTMLQVLHVHNLNSTFITQYNKTEYCMDFRMNLAFNFNVKITSGGSNPEWSDVSVMIVKMCTCFFFFFSFTELSSK